MITKCRDIGIIGLGLIGGSIGLALKGAKIPLTISGLARSPASQQKALQRGALDNAVQDISELAQVAEIIIIATPIAAVIPTLKKLIPHLRPGTIVTDVASVKGTIVKQARAIMPPHSWFVGGHPMAGSEKNGIDFARADLLNNAIWVLTPGEEVPPEQLQKLADVLNLLPIKTVTLDADQHDRAVALISHIPYLSAITLTELLQKQKKDDRDMAALLAASGFRDSTRVAMSGPEWGQDICQYNKIAVLDKIDGLIANYTHLKKLIKEDNSAELLKLLTAAANFRQKMY